MLGVQNNLISHKVFFKSFCRSQLHHKSVNLSFTIASIKNKLTDFCGNRLLQNDFKNTLCEIKPRQLLNGEEPGLTKLASLKRPRARIPVKLRVDVGFLAVIALPSEEEEVGRVTPPDVCQ